MNSCVHYFYFILYFFFFKSSPNYFIEKHNDILDVVFESKNSIPKKIWIFWYDVKIPELVFQCIKNIKDLHSEYDVNVLNKNTVKQYLDLDLDVLVTKMPMANLSDLIRLKLLQKYGGIWMDASIILENNIETFFLTEENIFEIIGFYNSYQSRGCEIPIIESWFLAAPPNSKFINKWLSYFEPIADLGSKGIFESFKEHPDFDELCKGLGDPEYLIVYMAAKLAYKDMKYICNMHFYCCDDSAFSVQIYSQWRTRKCTANLYIRDKFIFSPIYKLTSGDRKYFNFLRRFGLINNKSIIGIFLARMLND